MPRRARGFTIIEILIAVVVVSTLAVVALPSFLGQLKKGRRAEAVTALSQVQQAQERWRSTNATYTTDLGSTGLKIASTTASGYYTLAVSSANATGYVAKATAAGSQSSDSQCSVMAVQMDAGTIRYGSGSGADGDVLADTNKCWAK